jgi:hypothetical protein
MNYYYAQLGLGDIAIGVSQLSGPVVADNMISITETQYNNGSVIDHRYDRATGAWIYVPPEPIPPLIPVETL